MMRVIGIWTMRVALVIVLLGSFACFKADPRNVAGNPDSPQAVIFSMSVVDVLLVV